MNDLRLRWSVWPWTRHHDDERVPPVPGAAIHDSLREVTYRGTVNAQGELDHLEIELSGRIDDARINRLKSIPRERIAATVAAYVNEQRPGELQIVFEGGLLAGDGDLKTGPALYGEVARLMATHGWGRQELTAHFFPDEDPKRAVRTVDRWISKARAQHPTSAPRVATGRGYRPTNTRVSKSLTEK